MPIHSLVVGTTNSFLFSFAAGGRVLYTPTHIYILTLTVRRMTALTFICINLLTELVEERNTLD